jgi:flagellar export protein FliJ
LSLKATLKKQAQKDLAKAENERRKQQEILLSLKNELAGRLINEKDKRAKKLDLRRLDMTQRYFAQLTSLIGHQINVLREAERKTEEKRRKLVKASKEEKKYSRLKEIRREEYTQEMELMLQKETDEFAANVHRRSTKNIPR